ncbi:protein translocase subunit SecD [Nocardioides sp. cx-169]|uniref:protein translocase subunit SecD n=1 Tax=Nocardioides sp. cx-169 TaxID=2899080 RepID=UPI001E4E4035|nr:protein translocase subunit SecD [Nocardioides sp. cx-169]MCD4535099.1 protein translocase subunit SecD [Nocardioides sp. cx-169]
MARKQARPGRTLVVFFLGTALLYGLVALAGSWKPELGLDLQGGTRITMVAKGDPSGENLDEARQIIDQRVNGSGVSEAEVVTQGGDIIVVEIPGDPRRDLVGTVQRQAQLRFRLVACSDSKGCPPPTAGTPAPTPAPGATPDGAPSASPSASPSATPSATQSGSNRVAPGFATEDETPSPSQAPAPTEGASDAPVESSTERPSDEPTALPESFDERAVVPLDQAVAFMRGAYTQADYDAYNAYQCNEDGLISKVEGAPAALPEVPSDDPLKPLVACSEPEAATKSQPATPSIKYLLSPAVIAGTDLEDAGFAIPQNSVNYAVTLDIGGEGEDVFSKASSTLTPDVEQFAIVLDGEVISAPTFTSTIPDGSAQITGNFTESQAASLATSLKYGSLPISFEDPSIQTIGPSLAGDQLRAGLTAGAFGLGLVLIYCLLYYRGLGLVVVASLLAAAAVTYALVLLLSETAGFTLTLPGIAGLIIAVGVTADSFIILFERIRDEMRDGKTMRVAVETGWKRAKVTRLAAQVVSLLSAAVLYIFATGAVKGFGFALGLSTIVDLAILFWFTKPMISWLARFKFFNSGHRLSGLSAETLGIDALPTPAPSRARVSTGGRA